MKIFCAYAFQGEDIPSLKVRMKKVVDVLNTNGHEVYCSCFDPIVDEMEENNDIKAIFRRAFEMLNESEAVLAIVTSPNRSIGQIMEIGIALSQGKPVYLFEHGSAVGSTSLSKLVTKTYEWSNEAELLESFLKI